MLVVYDARVQYNQINVANLRNDGLQRFSFPGQLAEDHIANREPLLDNGNGMDFFGVPFASGGGVETAVKPLPADCRLTGIFDTIGELLKLLLVGDGEVDDVDDADDEQHDVAAVDDCSGEDSDSRRVGSFVTGDFGSAAAGGASSTSTQMFLILFLMLFLFLLLLLLLLFNNIPLHSVFATFPPLMTLPTTIPVPTPFCTVDVSSIHGGNFDLSPANALLLQLLSSSSSSSSDENDGNDASSILVVAPATTSRPSSATSAATAKPLSNATAAAASLWPITAAVFSAATASPPPITAAVVVSAAAAPPLPIIAPPSPAPISTDGRFPNVDIGGGAMAVVVHQ